MEQIIFNSKPFLLSLFVLFPLFILALIKLSMKPRKLNLPPSPKKLPFIGNLHQIGSLPHKSLHDLSLKYGPYMLANIGTTRFLVVSSADALEDITKNHESAFLDRPAILSGLQPLEGNGQDMLYHPFGEHWKQMRKFSALHLLSKNVVNRSQTMRDEEISDMLENIKGGEIDVSDVFNTVTGNVFHRSFTGSSQREESTTRHFLEWDVKFKKLLRSFSVADVVSSFGWMDRLTGHRTFLKSTFSELDIIMDKIIKESEKKSYVDQLICLRDNDKLDCDVKAIMQETLVAGVESVAVEQEWLFSELVRNPRVLKKAQEEVHRVVGTKSKISNHDIEQMHYLRCVVKETMRLHPPGMAPRETSSKWIKVGGYDIPPKTKVLVNVFAIQRDPKVWENPEEFIPERFIGKDIDFMGTHGYAPFGFGRRICPGIPLGIAMLEEVVANLLYRFDWKMPDGSKPEDLNMEEVSQFLVARKYPLRLVPVLHSKDTNASR